MFQLEIPYITFDEISCITEEVCKSNNLISNSDLKCKIDLFYSAMYYNSGLILVGDAFTGKSTVLNVIRQIYSKKEVIRWIFHLKVLQANGLKF